MQTNTIFTLIIGFLFGAVLYLSIVELEILIVFITTGVGYFVGEILDAIEDKHQKEKLSFSNMAVSQEIYHLDDLPEALIIYSVQERRTIVRIDFRVDAKPQNFRLSVLKNLQNFKFRVIEDAKKTIFSLTLDFIDYNYPMILEDSSKKEEFHLAIKERALDFRTAITKIIPGLVLTPMSNNTFLGINESTDFSPKPSLHNPPHSKNEDKFLPVEKDNIEQVQSEKEIDENIIFEDLVPVETQKPRTHEEKDIGQQNTVMNTPNENFEPKKSFLSESKIEELGNKQLLVVQDEEPGSDDEQVNDTLSIDYTEVINSDVEGKEPENDFNLFFTGQIDEKIKEKKSSLTSL
ncbi:MAG: hypothetical protein ACTSPG_03840 [Candidatus Hodarchaeales archaeon]